MATMNEALATIGDPNYRHIVPVSGGKDSSALAIYLKQTYPDLPAEYVFCDTQSELPETYQFLEKLESLLGAEIHKINALEYMNVRMKTDRNVFDFFLEELYSGFLPSPHARWCTINMKIKPFEQYIGNSTAFSYIGIRGDEDRDGYIPNKKPPKMSEKQNIIPVYPFKDDHKTVQDIKEILEGSGLGLPEYYQWRSRSGCYFCFYQQVGEWQGLKERHPELFEKAKQYENRSGSANYTWVERRSLAEIEQLSTKHEIKDMDDTDGCAICHI